MELSVQIGSHSVSMGEFSPSREAALQDMFHSLDTGKEKFIVLMDDSSTDVSKNSTILYSTVLEPIIVVN